MGSKLLNHQKQHLSSKINQLQQQPTPWAGEGGPPGQGQSGEYKISPSADNHTQAIWKYSTACSLLTIASGPFQVTQAHVYNVRTFVLYMQNTVARFLTPVQTGPGAQAVSYTMGTVLFLGVKQPVCGINHPPQSSTEVKERVELYIFSPFMPSWHVIG
jgi:hypothetical protein